MLQNRSNRDFILFVLTRLLATVGTQMASVAVGWQIYDLTGDPFDLGLIGLVQFIPMISLSLFAGHVADQSDRTRIIFFCIFSMMLCSLAFYLLETMLGLTRVLIYVVLFFMGITLAFLGPAAHALLPLLVPTERFPQAVAWNSSAWQAAMILGPSLGGVIYGFTDSAATVYAVSTGILGIAMVLFLYVQRQAKSTKKEPATWTSLLAGIQYVWKEKIILGATSLDLFAVLLGGAVALLPVYAKDVLHVGPAGLGILRAAPGVGAAFMGIILAFRPIERKVGTRMFFYVALFGLFTVLFGLSKNFIFSVICLTLMGAFDLVSVVIRQSLVQLRTPNEMRGRVSSVNLVFIRTSNELGEFESGLTAAWFGTVPAVIIGGIGTCLVTGLWAWLFPELRQLNHFEQREPIPKETS